MAMWPLNPPPPTKRTMSKFHRFLILMGWVQPPESELIYHPYAVKPKPKLHLVEGKRMERTRFRDVNEVLKEKEIECDRVREEVVSLFIVAKLLMEPGDDIGSLLRDAPPHTLD